MLQVPAQCCVNGWQRAEKHGALTFVDHPSLGEVVPLWSMSSALHPSSSTAFCCTSNIVEMFGAFM